MLAITRSLAATSFFAPSPFGPSPVGRSAVSVRVSSAVRMESDYEEYLRSRGSADLEATEAQYKSFKGIDQEFDGGDSGGGVVGDGNTDLEDQHNSATLGALRGGIADVTGATLAVGRGNVRTLDDVDYGEFNDADEFGTNDQARQATNARTSAAGANYFGRSTGLADKLIDNISEDDVKFGRMDKVRAQQKENWFNQRAIHAQNRAQGQGVVFGENQEARPRDGGYVARDAQKNKAVSDGGEISQADLANHLKDMAAAPASRLDGEEWAEVSLDGAEVTETFEMKASMRQTAVKEIKVKNDYNTFAPYQCNLLAGSSPSFSVTPNEGTMNRRSGDPVEVVVRFKPEETGVVHEAYVIFETEDFKRVYKIVGST